MIVTDIPVRGVAVSKNLCDTFSGGFYHSLTILNSTSVIDLSTENVKVFS